MGGGAFRARQRKDPVLAGIPLVVLSAAGDVERQAEALGVAGWLRKPYHFRQLLEFVERYR